MRGFAKHGKPIQFCEFCEQPFLRTNSHQRFCTKACNKAAAAQKLAREATARLAKARACIECGETYQPSNGQQRLCSDECRRVRNLRKVNEANRLRRQLSRCPYCGAKTDWPGKRCDDHRREGKRAEKNRSRMRLLGRERDNYTLTEIAFRDGQKCGICNLKLTDLDMKRKVPHPKAPTIDHILPIYHGGDDTRANVQLAHFHCNSLKGDRGVQQLRLLG